MDDPIARALAELGRAELPPSNVDAVRGRARPQILVRRFSASVLIVALLASTPFVADWLADTPLDSSRQDQPLPPAATDEDSPTSSQTPPACDIPHWRPTYLPWNGSRQPNGIPPTSVNEAPQVSSATWSRGDGSNDELHMGKLLYSGGGGQPGPALPDGTPGVLHYQATDDRDATTFTVRDTYYPRWSVIWSTRFSDGCRSLHLVLRIDDLSENDLKHELLKVARSLVERATPSSP